VVSSRVSHLHFMQSFTSSAAGPAAPCQSFICWPEPRVYWSGFTRAGAGSCPLCPALPQGA
jgi:hypothetical protein